MRSKSPKQNVIDVNVELDQETQRSAGRATAVALSWLDMLRFAQPARATRIAGTALAAMKERAVSSYAAMDDLKFSTQVRGTLLDKSI